SPIEPKIASPAGGAKAPRVKASAGSSEKRSGSSSHVPSYSKRIASVPRARLLLASPIGRVRPSRSICTSKSVIAGRSGWPLEMHVLGQIGGGQRLSDGVVADVGKLAETVEQAERLQNAGINSDAHIGVPCLDPLQGRAGCEGALRHHGHRQPPPTAGVVNVRAELAQRSPHRSGRVMGGRHRHLRTTKSINM